MTATSGLRHRSDLHLSRKIWHISSMSLIAWLNHVLPHDMARMLVLVIGGLFLVGDSLRLVWPGLNRLIVKYFGEIMRTHEVSRWAGTTWFIAALVLLLVCFEQATATCALLMIAFVDPLASLAGVTLGKHKLSNQKSWEGFVAAIVTGMAVLAGCVYLQLWRPESVLIAMAATALGVALVELYTPAWLDDNLTIPLAAALCLSQFPGVN